LLGELSHRSAAAESAAVGHVPIKRSIMFDRAPSAPCHNSVINIAAVESVGPTSKYCAGERAGPPGLACRLSLAAAMPRVAIDQAFQLARIRIDHHDPLADVDATKRAIVQRSFCGPLLLFSFSANDLLPTA